MHDAYATAGWALVAGGALIFALGWRSYRAWNRRIAALDGRAR